MSIVLDSGIVEKKPTIKQRINRISIDLDGNEISMIIHDLDEDGVINDATAYQTQIWDNEEPRALKIPTTVSVPAKDMHQAMTLIAQNKGWIGAGTASDDDWVPKDIPVDPT